MKERNLYKFQAPSNHVLSPHKPIIQAEDLSVLKAYFDICISNSKNEASHETYLEYQSHMKDQNDYRYLKAMPGIFELVIDILETNQANLFRKLSFLPVDGNPFLEFIQFAMLDFILNCKRPEPYKDNDERSYYCEVIIPIFKAFGNCTSSLTYAW